MSKIAPCLWSKDAQRVMAAMMGMVKIDIAGLQRACDGG
jgi:hypothetical protein